MNHDSNYGAVTRRARTVSDDLHNRIRGDILNGRLKPDEKLRLEALRAHYDVSLSPLREALMRLSSEGLVVLEGQRGFHVSPISRAELEDLTMLRMEMESLAIRRATEFGDDDWEASIIAALHRLSKHRKEDADNPNLINIIWEERHREFHFALLSGCNSPQLLRQCQTLYDCGSRYRAMLIACAHERDDLAEHRELLSAALARDADLAANLIRKHISQASSLLYPS